jgi:CcmD family protein
MTTAEKYVTAAYLVVFAVVLVYVLIMATKLARLEREVGELARLAREGRGVETPVEHEREEVSVG